MSKRRLFLRVAAMVCACVVACLSSCTVQVRLPKAPVFPSPVEASSSVGSPRQVIHKKIDRLAQELWRRLEQAWGIRVLRGRFALRLKFHRGRLLRCRVCRSEVSAVSEPSFRRVVRRRARYPFRVICKLLQQQTWPFPSADELNLEHLVRYSRSTSK